MLKAKKWPALRAAILLLVLSGSILYLFRQETGFSARTNRMKERQVVSLFLPSDELSGGRNAENPGESFPVDTQSNAAAEKDGATKTKETSAAETQAETYTPILIEIGGQQFTAMLFDTPSANALAEKLPLTLHMKDINNNEKAYFFSESFPTASAQPGHIYSGDLMLYGADCLVLFYDSFSSPYSYTRLGALDDSSGLAAALGAGNRLVTFRIREQAG